MLKREEVERIKQQYPKGTPIRLYSMEGEQTVPPGSRGVVEHVDDIGQIHMKWENGSHLALNVEEDRFEIITQQDEISEKKEQEFIDKINAILGKTDFLRLNASCNTENMDTNNPLLPSIILTPLMAKAPLIFTLAVPLIVILNFKGLVFTL